MYLAKYLNISVKHFIFHVENIFFNIVIFNITVKCKFAELYYT